MAYNPYALKYPINTEGIVPVSFIFWLFLILGFSTARNDTGVAVVSFAFAIVAFVSTCKRLRSFVKINDKFFVTMVIFWLIIGLMCIGTLITRSYIGNAVALFVGLLASYIGFKSICFYKNYT